jgi:hypothetical protein
MHRNNTGLEVFYNLRMLEFMQNIHLSSMFIFTYTCAHSHMDMQANTCTHKYAKYLIIHHAFFYTSIQTSTPTLIYPRFQDTISW